MTCRRASFPEGEQNQVVVFQRTVQLEHDRCIHTPRRRGLDLNSVPSRPLNITNRSFRQTKVNHSGIGYGSRPRHFLGIAVDRFLEQYGSRHARCRTPCCRFDRHSGIQMSCYLVVDYRTDSACSFRCQIPHDRQPPVRCSRSFAEQIELHSRGCSKIHWMTPKVGNRNSDCSNSRRSDHNWNLGLTAIRDRRLQLRQSRMRQ